MRFFPWNNTDPDASAYIAAVVAAGGSVSYTQSEAINTFYKKGKSDGWYSSLKRLYLPIWAAAAPNAIDMIALGSGTFAGGVTHTAGYVTTDGTTGHFLSDVSPGGAGCTLDGMGVFALYTAAASLNMALPSRFLGAQDSNFLSRVAIGSRGSNRFQTIGPNSNGIFTRFAIGDQRGVQFLGRASSISIFFLLRSSTLLTDSQTDASIALNSTVPMCWLAYNTNNLIGSYATSVAQLGVAGMTEGMSQAEAESFTDGLKTLWETCTGLTLP
jgi:hypothetical protein